MSVFQVLAVVVVAGFLVWAVESLVPMEPRLKRIFEVVVIIVVVIVVVAFLLAAFGLPPLFPGLRLV